jgi:hypothetical protein
MAWAFLALPFSGLTARGSPGALDGLPCPSWRKTPRSRLTIEAYSFARLSTCRLWVLTYDGSVLLSNTSQSKGPAHFSQAVLSQFESKERAHLPVAN